MQPNERLQIISGLFDTSYFLGAVKNTEQTHNLNREVHISNARLYSEIIW